MPKKQKPFRKTHWIWLILVALMVLIALLSLFVGRYGLTPLTVFKALLNLTPNEGLEVNIVRSIRLPRVLLSLLVGAGLAISGATFQGVFRNPLVSPDVLSVSSGAAFGAVLAIMMNGNSTLITILALVCGCVSVFLTYTFARVNREITTLSLVLSGMIMSALFNALISLMKYVADTDTQLPAITYWLLGGFAAATFDQVMIAVGPVIIGMVILFLMSHKINILSFGDEEAHSLGINPNRTRIIVIFASTLITAACITVTGIIGWVGLVIPHIARMIVGPNHSRLLPASALIGASFITAADFVARTAISSEIPVSILTALIGAPFFAVLFRKTGGIVHDS